MTWLDRLIDYLVKIQERRNDVFIDLNEMNQRVLVRRKNKMTEKAKDYSFWIGLGKSVKSNAVVLIPFLIAVAQGLPEQYAVGVSGVVYLLKNLYEVKTGKKLV